MGKFSFDFLLKRGLYHVHSIDCLKADASDCGKHLYVKSDGSIGTTIIQYPEVNTYANLPNTPSTGDIYLVLTTTGIIFINRKLAGFYRWSGTQWDYMGDLLVDATEVDYQPTVPSNWNSVIQMSALTALDTLASNKENNLTFSTGLTRSTNTITSDLSTGKSGGQTVIGSISASENLTLSSTSHATKGKILLGTSAYDEVNNRFGIKINDPAYATELRVDGMASTWNADRLIGLTNTTAATSVAKFQSSPGLLFRSNSWKNSDASYPGYFRIASMASSDGDGVNDLVFSYSRDGSSYSTGFRLRMPAATGTPALISDIARFGGIQEWYFGISGNYIFDCYGDADATIQHYRSLLSDPGYAMTLAAGSKKNSATNAAGGELKLKSGASSGNASSYMTFWTATAGNSGNDTRSATEKMRLLGNGYLGIGLTTPTSLLHLDAGTSTASALKFTANATTGQTATDGFDIGIDTLSNGKIWNNENTYLSFATNNTEAFRINADNSTVALNSKYHYYRNSISIDSDNDLRSNFNGCFSIDIYRNSWINLLSVNLTDGLIVNSLGVENKLLGQFNMLDPYYEYITSLNITYDLIGLEETGISSGNDVIAGKIGSDTFIYGAHIYESSTYIPLTITNDKDEMSINCQCKTYFSDFIKLTPLADSPSSPEEGMVYCGADHHLYYYNGTTWKQLDN